MKYKQSRIRYLEEGMSLAGRLYCTIVVKQVFGEACPEWMWNRVHENFTQFYQWQSPKYILAHKVYSVEVHDDTPPVLVWPCEKTYREYRNMVACHIG